jgi:hypothetical protein
MPDFFLFIIIILWAGFLSYEDWRHQKVNFITLLSGATLILTVYKFFILSFWIQGFFLILLILYEKYAQKGPCWGMADKILWMVLGVTLHPQYIPWFWLSSGLLGSFIYLIQRNDPIPFLPPLMISWVWIQICLSS